ncbi:MAG: hypothetical protein NTW87_11645 [Planctomycetota bacterium]|nr:hypothetical protein [Planctomycetota bacterium]
MARAVAGQRSSTATVAELQSEIPQQRWDIALEAWVGGGGKLK